MHFSGKIIDVEITIFRLMCLRCLCVLSVTRCYAKVVHNLLTKIIPYYKWNCITSKNKILEHKLWFCCLSYGKICTTQTYDWILMRIICLVTNTKLKMLASICSSVFTNICIVYLVDILFMEEYKISQQYFNRYWTISHSNRSRGL